MEDNITCIVYLFIHNILLCKAGCGQVVKWKNFSAEAWDQMDSKPPIQYDSMESGVSCENNPTCPAKRYSKIAYIHFLNIVYIKYNIFEEITRIR